MSRNECIELFEEIGVNYEIHGDPTEDPPDRAELETIRDAGKTISWNGEEWEIIRYVEAGHKSAGARLKIPRPVFFGFAAIAIFMLLSQFIDIDNLPSLALPTSASVQEISTPTSELLIQNPIAHCGPGARTFEVTKENVNGVEQIQLTGLVWSDYYLTDNGESPTTFFIAEQNLPDKRPGYWTILYLMNNTNDDGAEYSKMMLVDAENTDPNVLCTEAISCSAVWNTVMSWSNYERNNNFYGVEGTDPRYLKNVGKARFEVIREWINAVYDAWANNIEIPRCITFPPLSEMSEIRAEFMDKLAKEGGRAQEGILPPGGSRSNQGLAPINPPIIITATPTATPLPFAQELTDAFNTYQAMVGFDKAIQDFTPDHGKNCFVSMTVNFASFKTEDNTTSLLRRLEPQGFTVQAVQQAPYFARGLTPDGNGFNVCLNIDGLETNFGDATWKFNTSGQIATISWSQQPSVRCQRLIGASYIAPACSQALIAENTRVPATQPSQPTVTISNLGDMMDRAGYSVLYSGCPVEPLSGTLSLTDAKGSSRIVVYVNFGNDAYASQKYSPASCNAAGGLTYTTYDQGQGASQIEYDNGNLPSVYVWPMDKVQAAIPSSTPGAPQFPANGSSMPLADVLKYLLAKGVYHYDIGCKEQTFNASTPQIEGWPSRVPVIITNGLTYYADFSPIAGRATQNLCRSYYQQVPDPFTADPNDTKNELVNPLSLKFSTSQMPASWGPQITYEGWYFAPFH